MQKLVLSFMLLVFSCLFVGCSNNNKDEVKNMNEIDATTCTFAYKIDCLSSISFDYENPNYGLIQLDVSSSYIYDLTGEEVYKLISEFNTISLDNMVSKDDFYTDEVTSQIHSGIDIEVSYKYVISKSNTTRAIVNFYVLKDGTLILLDARKQFMYYSDKGAIDYDTFKDKIIAMRPF